MEDLPQKFYFDEFLQKYRYHILLILLGLVLIGGGFIFLKKSFGVPSTKVEILQSAQSIEGDGEITAEISGAVINPGVYKLKNGSRIDDLLITAGGFSEDADRVWAEKYLNRAAKLTDGQKVYAISLSEQSESSSAKSGGGYQTISSNFSSDSNKFININSASVSELDSLSGIGPVYAQKIVEHRPYSKTEDLVTSGVITQTLYEKIKNSITTY
ncbi:MAG: Late competence protein comEA [Candidatus Woesebacteria bacterium GW2011_GWA1_41_7]|uniref:Late competence protein comEA n=1 Tax=Candidatus Woesebacteria bacterium GW2011_GWA1_41_7 TaxID=1618556 RepID=A0A0G0X0G6_9BACT|nr:MAG: Late competence protein comEA [Candidatus Woesebacteria bacterium GW2011_GWA1_41_7]